MGSPAGFSSLLTSTDMSPLCSSLSSWWLQSFARLKPRQKPLLTLTTDTTDTTDSSMDTVTLVTPITDTAISDTTDMGITMVRGRLSPTMDTIVTMDIMDTMATMDMDVDTDTMAMDIMDIMDITDTSTD